MGALLFLTLASVLAVQKSDRTYLNDSHIATETTLDLFGESFFPHDRPVDFREAVQEMQQIVQEHSNLQNMSDKDPLVVLGDSKGRLSAAYYALGVANLFGLGTPKRVQRGILYMGLSSRMGNNFATLTLANCYQHGLFSCQKSHLLAHNYLMQIASAWVNDLADSPPYDYTSVKSLYKARVGARPDFNMGTRGEREFIIETGFRNPGGPEAHMAALGYLIGSEGFPKDNVLAARFACVAAATSAGRHVYNLDTVNQKELLRHKALHEAADAAGAADPAARGAAQDALDDMDLVTDIEGYDLTYFKAIMPLTSQAYLEAVRQIVRAIEEELATDHWLHFNPRRLPVEEVLADPRLNYKTSDNTFIQEAALLFMDTATNFVQELAQGTTTLLRMIEGGYAQYNANLTREGITTRTWRETCTRRGQAYGVLAWSLLNGHSVPAPYQRSSFVREAAKVLYIASAKNGCHMGLTGLAFLAISGYAPEQTCDASEEYPGYSRLRATGPGGPGGQGGGAEDCAARTAVAAERLRVLEAEHAKLLGTHAQADTSASENAGAGTHPGAHKRAARNIDALALANMSQRVAEARGELNSLRNYCTDPKGRVARPRVAEAVMAFDVASIAGSFEASFFEALILSRSVARFSPRDFGRSKFLFDGVFHQLRLGANPYAGVAYNVYLAKLLVEHSAYAAYLGGEILAGVFLHEGYGCYARNPERGNAFLARAARRIAFKWLIVDEAEDFVKHGNILAALPTYLMAGLAGDVQSAKNAVALLQGLQAPTKVPLVSVNVYRAVSRLLAAGPAAPPQYFDAAQVYGVARYSAMHESDAGGAQGARGGPGGSREILHVKNCSFQGSAAMRFLALEYLREACPRTDAGCALLLSKMVGADLDLSMQSLFGVGADVGTNGLVYGPKLRQVVAEEMRDFVTHDGTIMPIYYQHKLVYLSKKYGNTLSDAKTKIFAEPLAAMEGEATAAFMDVCYSRRRTHALADSLGDCILLSALFVAETGAHFRTLYSTMVKPAEPDEASRGAVVAYLRDLDSVVFQLWTSRHRAREMASWMNWVKGYMRMKAESDHSRDYRRNDLGRLAMQHAGDLRHVTNSGQIEELLQTREVQNMDLVETEGQYRVIVDALVEKYAQSHARDLEQRGQLMIPVIKDTGFYTPVLYHEFRTSFDFGLLDLIPFESSMIAYYAGWVYLFLSIHRRAVVGTVAGICSLLFSDLILGKLCAMYARANDAADAAAGVQDDEEDNPGDGGPGRDGAEAQDYE